MPARMRAGPRARRGADPRPQRRTAERSRPGILAAEGSASKATNRRMTSYDPAAVANHGGLGRARKGPRTTDFRGRPNISAFPTTPVPDWLSVRGWPGYAPQVVEPMAKETPCHTFTPIEP